MSAVLGHEITHVANGDMVTLALIQGVLNTFVMFLARVIGSMIDGALQGDRDRERAAASATSSSRCCCRPCSGCSRR